MKRIVRDKLAGLVITGIFCGVPCIASAIDPNEIRISVRVDALPFIHIDATITLPAAPAGVPTFIFTDLAPDAVQRVAATQGQREINVEQRPLARPGRREQAAFALPSGTSGPVRIAYDVNPAFYPPGSDHPTPADARARVTPELGVLRTTTILRQLLVRNANRVRFDLPEGWTAATPWAKEDSGFLLSEQDKKGTPEYIGIGPFGVNEHRVDGIIYRIAICAGVQGIDDASLFRILTNAREIAGRPAGTEGDVFCVVVVPEGFVHGGSAGRRTAMQPPDPVVLAHEMFHWWDNSKLIRQEANWFCEGFTEYYGIRLARVAGLIDAAFEEACFADLNGEMRFLESDRPRSLADASLASIKDSEAGRIVYAKGALLALHMARELEPHGKSLNAIMSRVLALGRGGLSNDDLLEQFHGIYDGVLDNAFDQYVLQANALPDMKLPAATGKTGVARYLPKQ